MIEWHVDDDSVCLPSLLKELSVCSTGGPHSWAHVIAHTGYTDDFSKNARKLAKTLCDTLNAIESLGEKQ
jgi:hypothetical protein